METHDLPGPYYWHIAWYVNRRHPFFAREGTTEIDAPYRIGLSRVLSIPGFKFALVFGTWVSRHKNEESALAAAMPMHETPVDLKALRPEGAATDEEFAEWLGDQGWTYKEVQA